MSFNLIANALTGTLTCRTAKVVYLHSRGLIRSEIILGLECLIYKQVHTSRYGKIPTNKRNSFVPPLKFGNYLFVGKRTLYPKSQYRPDKKEIKSFVQTNVHYTGLDEIIEHFKTDKTQGLSSRKAEEILQKNGENVLIPMANALGPAAYLRPHKYTLIVLFAGTILCFSTAFIESLRPRGMFKYDNLFLGVELVVVTLLTCCFSYYHETKCEREMESFRSKHKKFAKVVRDGQLICVEEKTLVVGDIAIIEAGDIVPADMRVFEAENLRIDCSSLNSSEEVEFKSDKLSSMDPLETENLIFYRTRCVEGYGKGVVFNTGDRTAIASVIKLTTALQLTETPLFREVKHFVRMRMYVALAVGVVVLSICLALKFFWLKVLTLTLVLWLSNMPELLLNIVTANLTHTARQMASKNCLVKDLEAVEKLGLCSVVCIDKNACVTQNKLIVSHIWLDDMLVNTEYLFDLNPQKILSSATWKLFTRAACLCTVKEVENSSHNLTEKSLQAESAILDFFNKSANYIKEKIEPSEIIFRASSSNSKHGCVHSLSHTCGGEENEECSYVLCMKGYIEDVMKRCSTIMLNGDEVSLTSEMKLKLRDVWKQQIKAGEQIIGICDFEYPKSEGHTKMNEEDVSLSGLRFLGFVGIIDPPRPAIERDIQKCRNAGIKIILLTSEGKSIAKAIARRVGIISMDSETLDELSHRLKISVDAIEPGVVNAIVVTGLNLTVMGTEELDELIQSYEEIVFAEIKPSQKIRIVGSCKRLKMVVAMTGTDVLDCPAVQKADIGIGLGANSCDMCNEDANVILLDSDFASIVSGIQEGRVVFDNIQKTICYNLACNLAEFLPFMLVVICQIPLPLGASFILLIYLSVSMLPTLSLIYETQESDIMQRRPIDPYSHRILENRIVHKSFLQIGIPKTIAGLYVYFVVMAENGFMPEDLIGIRNAWNSDAVNDLSDSFNQQWTYTSRKALEYTCQTAFFMSVVLSQLFDLIMCRSWRDSLQKRGICNRMMIFSLLFEVSLAVILCYIPGMQKVLHLYPLKFLWWFPGLPFSVLILGYDELRKFLIRHSEPNSWLERET